MSLILGALGGMGDAAQRWAETNQRQWGEQEMEALRNKLAGEREAAMMRLRKDLDEAPLKRLGERAKALIGSQVPVEPEAVSSLGGAEGITETKPDGTKRIGLKGDPVALRKQIENDPNFPKEDKAAALAQLDAQIAAEEGKNADAVKGKTRGRTSDEAMTEAVNQSMTEDPVAYAEYEAKIGKPKRDDRRIANAERREDTRVATEERRALGEEKRLAQYDAKMDAENAYRNRREDRLDALENLRLLMEGQRSDRADAAAQRAAAVELMKNTERELERYLGLLKDPMATPEQQRVFQSRVTQLNKELSSVRATVGGMAGIEGVPSEPERKPIATTEAIEAYAKKTGKSFSQALEEAAKTHDVSGVKMPSAQGGVGDRSKPSGALIGERPPAAKESLLSAAGGSGNQSLDTILAEKLPRIQSAGAALKEAQAQLSAAGKSGDQRVLQTYMDNVRKAQAEWDKSLEGIPASREAAIRKSLGL